ncbi:tyrosine-type recombinase/integrase [Streptomyces sp. NPDC090798]|uniref:tyrosine-type recombinase/integrase n=1 Tax=Streptomyces sp. NPDC090798 TaxID=3365968 RepID=UPI0038244511
MVHVQPLRLAHTFGVPVPLVHSSAVLDGWLGMLVEDLGLAVRDADDLDGVAAAVVLHGTRTAAALPVLDQARLRTLPSRALEHLARLRMAERWQDADDVEDALDRMTQAAEARSAGTTVAPFGWVHSEFHPTSLHIGQHGWRLLDFASAFTGPGLLDLASGHGTLDTPDPVRLRVFPEQYGTPDALTRRGGPTAETLALGRHRIWAMPPYIRAAIVTLAGSGLHIGELLGLKLSDVDFKSGTIPVERQRLQSCLIGPPKTAKSRRAVPVGEVVTDALLTHLAARPSREWLFMMEEGEPLNYRRWKTEWNCARKEPQKAENEAAEREDRKPVELPHMVTHDLRHFFASALIAGGASVKQVQLVLGHASAVITPRIYAHLWPGEEDRTRTVMDAVFGVPRAGCGQSDRATGETEQVAGRAV